MGPNCRDGLALSRVDCQIDSAPSPEGTIRLPTYEYRCERCPETFDVVQAFQDDPLTICPTCGSPVRKVFGNVGIVFKGNGFYKTDSRNGTGTKTAAGDPASTSGSASDSGSESPGSSETTAAPSGNESSGKGTPSSGSSTSPPSESPSSAAPAKGAAAAK